MADAPQAPARPLSKLALVAYLLGLFPTGPLAVPLGGWAWARIRSRGQSGLPVAVSAMVLGMIWVVGLGFLYYLRASSGAAVFEDAALTELRTIAAGQLQFQRAGIKDEDHDGRGEFATLPELAGRFNVSKIFGRLEGGLAHKYRYYFRCDLPPTVEGREVGYLVWAWPEHHGHPAVRAFLVDGRSGRIWACSNGTHIRGRYSGTERQPGHDAGFPAGTGPTDGEDWAPVG